MEDSGFNIVIQGPGVRVDRTIPESTVYKVLQLLLHAGEEVRRERAVSRAEAENRRSLRRAFQRHRPTSHAERMALVVAFVERVHERAARRDEIADWLVLAGEPVPSNFSRDLSLAQEKGLIIPVEGEGPERYELGRRGRLRFRMPGDAEVAIGRGHGRELDSETKAELLRLARRTASARRVRQREDGPNER